MGLVTEAPPSSSGDCNTLQHTDTGLRASYGDLHRARSKTPLPPTGFFGDCNTQQHMSVCCSVLQSPKTIRHVSCQHVSIGIRISHGMSHISYGLSTRYVMSHVTLFISINIRRDLRTACGLLRRLRARCRSVVPSVCLSHINTHTDLHQARRRRKSPQAVWIYCAELQDPKRSLSLSEESWLFCCHVLFWGA